ncbi:hypothetical protein [Alterisphingorhabdus coralli]|uniref:Lipoprotein n=1 Tax=Alterisphingorhabdus coralli TaxID=3071408 RepID=A0AA97HZ63_9SPHN|nr:hypothetical protein [Parasphingorhabdus sp. SCSIO 66989]WOE74254.1 hypothetical protein RB602_10345 [Parasphingorhabdus sp. SCSIO 66989]
MKRLAILSSALLVTACGGGGGEGSSGDEITLRDGDAEMTVNSDSGDLSLNVETKGGSFTAKTDNDNTEDTPYGLKLASDAEVMTNMKMEDEGHMASHTVIYTTSQSADDMMGTYRAEAESAGFSVTQSGSMDKASILSAKRGEKEQLRVVASPDGSGKTTVNLTANITE